MVQAAEADELFSHQLLTYTQRGEHEEEGASMFFGQNSGVNSEGMIRGAEDAG